MGETPIYKTVLTSPGKDDLLGKLGGYAQAMKMDELGMPVEFERREFATKADYGSLVIVQRGVMVVNRMNEVLVLDRASTEEAGGQMTERFTKKASVLTGGAADLSYQAVLDKKVFRTGIQMQNDETDYVTMSGIKGGYLFLVKVVRERVADNMETRVDDQLRGFWPLREVLGAVESKPMEYNLLIQVMRKLGLDDVRLGADTLGQLPEPDRSEALDEARGVIST